MVTQNSPHFDRPILIALCAFAPGRFLFRKKRI